MLVIPISLLLCSPEAFGIFIFLAVCVWGGLSDFFPWHHLLSCCYNFIDSDCVLWRYTGVKDNWSWGCLVCGNRESGTLCQRYSLYVQRQMIQRLGLHKKTSVFPNTNRCILFWRKLLELIPMRFQHWLANRNFSAVIGLDTQSLCAFIFYHSTLLSGESEVLM